MGGKRKRSFQFREFRIPERRIRHRAIFPTNYPNQEESASRCQKNRNANQLATVGTGLRRGPGRAPHNKPLAAQ